MVETTSVREEKPKLSAKDRLCLIQTINALPSTQFDELVFALDPPKGVVASNSAAQGQRSKELLDWLESSSGPGLAAADEILQILIPKATKTAPQPIAFAISGKMGDLTASELEAVVELLRQKTGDTSISLAFSKEGSIKLILNGSLEGLAKLQEIFLAGEIELLDTPSTEGAFPVDTNTQEARKTRLIQALRIRGQSLRTPKVSDLARALALYSDPGLVLTLYNDLDLARDSALALTRDIDVALAHNIYNARDIDVANHARDLVQALTRARDIARDIDVALDRNRALNRARDIALALYSALDRNRALALDLDLYSARNRDIYSDLARARTLALDLDRNYASDLNLSEADLRGANLRDIDLTGVDLTGADLTYADVTGTIFGNNPGLTETDKRDLQGRGAIFQDPPTSDVPALVLR